MGFPGKIMVFYASVSLPFVHPSISSLFVKLHLSAQNPSSKMNSLIRLFVGPSESTRVAEWMRTHLDLEEWHPKPKGIKVGFWNHSQKQVTKYQNLSIPISH